MRRYQRTADVKQVHLTCKRACRRRLFRQCRLPPFRRLLITLLTAAPLLLRPRFGCVATITVTPSRSPAFAAAVYAMRITVTPRSCAAPGMKQRGDGRFTTPALFPPVAPQYCATPPFSSVTHRRHRGRLARTVRVTLLSRACTAAILHYSYATSGVFSPSLPSYHYSFT